MIKFKFHRDKFGVHVYYADMNKEAIHGTIDAVIFMNYEKIQFDPRQTAVVPIVKRLWSSCPKSQVVTDYEFEVIDIDYPADERLIPLRHYNHEKVNYFQVDLMNVAVKLAHSLCQDKFNLKFNNSQKRGTYYLGDPDYYAIFFYWTIEGKQYTEPLIDKIFPRDFIGDLAECNAAIIEVEKAIRACVEEWRAHDKEPSELNVGLVINFLDGVVRKLGTIDPKIRTAKNLRELYDDIHQFRQNVLNFGLKQVENEENS